MTQNHAAKQAWVTLAGDSVCVRHAVERVAGEDDMPAADLTASIYAQLRDRGHQDVY